MERKKGMIEGILFSMGGSVKKKQLMNVLDLDEKQLNELLAEMKREYEKEERGIRLIGSTLRSRPTEMKARILHELEEKVWPKFVSKEIRPVIHAVLPVARAEEAHAILQRNGNIGKVVLEID